MTEILAIVGAAALFVLFGVFGVFYRNSGDTVPTVDRSCAESCSACLHAHHVSESSHAHS